MNNFNKTCVTALISIFFLGHAAIVKAEKACDQPEYVVVKLSCSIDMHGGLMMGVSTSGDSLDFSRDILTEKTSCVDAEAIVLNRLHNHRRQKINQGRVSIDEGELITFSTRVCLYGE